MPHRVATAQMYNNSHVHVAKAREKEVTSAEKASSFKEIVRPSQDPGGWMGATYHKDALSVRQSECKNANTAMQYLSATETVLSQVQEYVQRAKELSVAAAGKDPYSESAREHLYRDLRQVYEALVQAANTRFGNRGLFSGFMSETPAFDLDGDFLGDSGVVEVEIDHKLKVPSNITGEGVFLGKGLKNGVNILETFQRLMEGLQTGDHEMIRGTLDDLHWANEQVSIIRSQVGGYMNKISRALDSHAAMEIEDKVAISRVEEADAIKTFSDLARDQAILQASILTSQKLLRENPYFKE